jgi:O-antigen ligase
MILELKKYQYDFFPVLLIVLLPFSLISGPAIPDISLSILGLIFIFKSIKDRLYFYYLNYFSYFFFFFYLIILLSGLLSSDPFVSLIERESLFYFRFYFFSLALCYFSQKYPVIIKYLAISLLLTIIIIIIDGSVEYFRGVSLFGIESAETRLFSVFRDEPIVGRYISTATMLFVSLMIYYYGYSDNKIILLIFTVLMAGEVFTFMSGERAAFGMIVAFSFSGFILIAQRRLERFIFIILSVIFVLTLALNQDRSAARLSQTINEVQEREFIMIAASPVHEQHYNSAVKMFKDNPIIGIGSNLFRHLCNKEKYITGPQSCTTHPHHYYIQILAENGILGFIILLSVFLALSFNLCMHFFGLIFKKDSLTINDQNLLFYLFLFVVMTPFMPHGSFYNNWTNVPIFMGLGIFLSFFIKTNKHG